MKPKHTYLVLIAFAIVTIACFTTCKKYPEDKFYSFKTAHGRLQGEWQLHKIELNGNDVGYLYNDSLPQTYDTYRFWFKFNQKIKDSPRQESNLIIINKSSKKYKDAYPNSDVSYSGFTLGKKDGLGLSLGGGPVNDLTSFYVFKFLIGTRYINSFWQFKKLHNKQMIIERTVNNNTYRLYFNKTRNELFIYH